MLYSIAHEWDFELNTTREIPYLQAALYYFGYLINTVALSWREKSILWTNENKRIDNPRIKSVKCLGDQAQYGKKLWITTNNNRRHFQYKKLSVIDFYITSTNLSAALLKLARGKSLQLHSGLNVNLKKLRLLSIHIFRLLFFLVTYSFRWVCRHAGMLPKIVKSATSLM